jgi:uncharacterized HhH-GPD family protein
VIAVAPASIPWTDDAEANQLLASDPNALLIGFVLDQQVPVQKAFAGPKVLHERLGHLDPARIAAMDPEAFAAVCAERPAVHRFPRAMAGRIQSLADTLARDFAGDGAKVWEDATDGADLFRRISSLPGFGEMKVKSLATLLHHRYDVRLAGLEERLPKHKCLGAVGTPEELAEYQAAKRAAKAAARSASA